MAGRLDITVEFAAQLTDVEWFGKQDPYAVVQVGSQKQQTKAAKDGGKNPVWNETLTFQVLNENEVAITLMDKEMLGDDLIGRCTVPLATARARGNDRQQVPLFTKSGKQQGTLAVILNFAGAGAPGGYYPGQPGAPPQGYPPAAGYPGQGGPVPLAVPGGYPSGVAGGGHGMHPGGYPDPHMVHGGNAPHHSGGHGHHGKSKNKGKGRKHK